MSKGLDVVDGRRQSDRAVLSREGRLLARLTLLALQRLEQSRLLAAYVGTRAGVHHHLVIETGLAQDVLTQIALLASCRDRFAHALDRKRGLPADVDERLLRARGPGRNQDALQHLKGRALHDQAILERTRLGFVAVRDQHLGVIALLGHEAPLQTRGEARPAPASQARVLDELDDIARLHLDGPAQSRETAAALESLQRAVGVLAVVLGEVSLDLWFGDHELLQSVHDLPCGREIDALAKCAVHPQNRGRAAGPQALLVTQGDAPGRSRLAAADAEM